MTSINTSDKQNQLKPAPHRGAVGVLVPVSLNPGLSGHPQRGVGGGGGGLVGAGAVHGVRLAPQGRSDGGQLHEVLELQAALVHRAAAQLLQQTPELGADPVAVQAVPALEVQGVELGKARFVAEWIWVKD